jgi:hypothetical protein
MLRTARAVVFSLAGLGAALPVRAEEAPKQPSAEAPSTGSTESTAADPKADPNQATSPEQAEALRLFEEGKKLYEAGDYASACKKFEESVQKKASIGNRFQLANCWERVGRTASAHALFLEVAEATRSLGQADREKVARERAAALEPQLSRVHVEVQAPEGFEIEIDGKKVESASLQHAIPLDPGTHTLRASAPNRPEFTTSIEVKAGAGIIVVSVPMLAEPAIVPVVAASPPPAEPSEDKPPPSTRRAVGIALLGVGSMGVLAGVGLAILSANNQSDADKACGDDAQCSPSELELKQTLEDDAEGARNLAIVGIGTGVAAAGAAIFLLVTDASARAQRSKDSKPHFSVRPAIGVVRGGFGAAAVGSF